MLGENTLFLTPNGFKKLKDLEKYDEVMNSNGHFTYIKRFGPWKPVNKCVKLSTDEEICCGDNLLWDLSTVGRFIYTDELELGQDIGRCARSRELTRVRARKLKNSYELAVSIPEKVPGKYFTARLEDKLEFLAGLIDSPMCELGRTHGIYVFYTYSQELAHGIVALACSIGYGALCRRIPIYNIYVVRIHIGKYEDILPVRDPYKACFRGVGLAWTPVISKLREIKPSDVVLGRTVELNDGNPLIGYSLVSVY